MEKSFYTGVWKPTQQRPLTIIPPASRKFNPAGAVGDGRKVSRTKDWDKYIQGNLNTNKGEEPAGAVGDGRKVSRTTEGDEKATSQTAGSSRQSNLERIQAHKIAAPPRVLRDENLFQLAARLGTESPRKGQTTGQYRSEHKQLLG
ncbi:hypothetical protein MMC12_007764 [Toensbergia leucococca]|nr:hypothetical protein [Toensbergia leucococca]